MSAQALDIADHDDQKGEIHAPPATDSMTTKRKRKRIRLACNTCRGRKQRCDGLQPKCTHCNIQKLDCSYESASEKAEVSQLYVHKLLLRIEELESERELRRESAPSERKSTNSTASPGKSTVQDRRAQQLQENDSLVTPPASVSADLPQVRLIQGEGSGETVPTEDQNQDVPSTSEPTESLAQGFLGASSNITFLRALARNGIESRQDDENETADSPKANSLGSAKLSLYTQSSINAWPQRSIADHLVECFMELCYPQYPFIYGPVFRKRYELTWTSNAPQSDLWIATVNIVFALGCQFSPKVSPQMGEEFFNKAKSLINFETITSSNMETLGALILMGLYLQSSASFNSSWSVIALTVRMAQSLGLHMRKTYKPSWTQMTREIRKRAWWACYVLDSVSAIMLGRPQMISDDAFDAVDLPERIEDELYLDEHISAPSDGPPDLIYNNVPCELDFFITTLHICQFMREIRKAYDNAWDHQKMLEIDDRLCQWVANVPPHLRHDSKMPSNRKLWRQKVVLTSRFLHMRVLLHRPCISQELSINDKLGPFDPIREGTNDRLTCLRAELCTTVSVKIIQHISGFYADGLNSAWWYDLNHLFAASNVLLVQLLRQRNVEYYTGILNLATDVMRGMKESGKVLAGQYLRMIENLQHQIAHSEGSSLSAHQSYASSNLEANTDESSGNETGSRGVANSQQPIQNTPIGDLSFNSSVNETGDLDVNSLLESFSYPWSVPLEDPLSDESLANLLFGQPFGGP